MNEIEPNLPTLFPPEEGQGQFSANLGYFEKRWLLLISRRAPDLSDRYTPLDDGGFASVERNQYGEMKIIFRDTHGPEAATETEIDINWGGPDVSSGLYPYISARRTWHEHGEPVGTPAVYRSSGLHDGDEKLHISEVARTLKQIRKKQEKNREDGEDYRS